MANERCLINVNALPRNTWLDVNVLAMAVQKIDDAPTVEAVPVVRCKDCKYFAYNNENETYCRLVEGLSEPLPDNFCSYGERRRDV